MESIDPCPVPAFTAAAGSPPVEWRVSPGLVDYDAAVAEMEARAAAIAAGETPELVWLLEHPPLFTVGTGTRPEDVGESPRFPVFRTGRGGRVTYHGPGQRVAYVMLDLKRRQPDVRCFVSALECWIIGALAEFGVRGEQREGRIGVWIARPERGPGIDDKIAAIGIRIRRWVSFHGVSLNVRPDLSHYRDIVPCGIREHGVTSLAALGVSAGMDEVDAALRSSFAAIFGPTTAEAGARLSGAPHAVGRMATPEAPSGRAASAASVAS